MVALYPSNRASSEACAVSGGQLPSVIVQVRSASITSLENALSSLPSSSEISGALVGCAGSVEAVGCPPLHAERTKARDISIASKNEIFFMGILLIV